MTTAAGTPTVPTGWIADQCPLCHGSGLASAESFGARLGLIRQRMGWSIAEAARACGVNGESWRLWEQGREPSRLTTIAMAIADASGCDYLWLVHGPDRGSVRPPTGYAPGGRVIAKIGASRETRIPIHRAGAARPVRQTKPMRQKSRPMTPVAV